MNQGEKNEGSKELRGKMKFARGLRSENARVVEQKREK